MDGRVLLLIMAALACAREVRERPAAAPGDPAPRRPLEGRTLEDSKAGAKVSRELLELLDEYELHARERAGEEFEASTALLRVKEGAVAIECSAAGEPGELVADLEGLGMTGVASYAGSVGGWLPIPAIAELEALESLRFARAAMSMTN